MSRISLQPLRRIAAPALLALAALSAPAHAAVIIEGDIEVRERPPVIREEVIGVAPHPGWVWTPGHWVHRGEWQWRPGEWVRPPHPNAVWIPGHWNEHARGWTWIPGHWREKG